MSANAKGVYNNIPNIDYYDINNISLGEPESVDGPNDADNRDVVKSIFGSGTYELSDYRKMFSIAFDEYKRVAESDFSIDPEFDLSAINKGDEDEDETNDLLDEICMMYGFLAGLNQSLTIMKGYAHKIIEDGEAYRENKSYLVLKLAFDKITSLFFEPIKRVQYTRGKSGADEFFKFASYGALLDIKDLLFKIRYHDIPRISRKQQYKSEQERPVQQK